jgi:hypothetical protein
MNKKGIVIDQLGKVLLGLAVLLVFLLLIFFFKDSAAELVQGIIDAMRFS